MQDLDNRGITQCASKVTLAAGTTTTLSTTGTTTFFIGGKAYTKAAISNGATPTTDATTGAAFTAQAIGTGCVYVVGLDKDGNMKVSQGEIVTLAVDGSFNDVPDFPSIPDTMCPIAYELVRLAPATATTPAVATWTFGTNNQVPVTGVTFTLVDVGTLPRTPQAS